MLLTKIPTTKGSYSSLDSMDPVRTMKKHVENIAAITCLQSPLNQ